MKIATRTLALTTAAAVAAVPTALMVAAPANADVERSGACGTGRYEISADREGRGYEVNVDLDNLAPGSRYKVVVRHDGKIFVNSTLRADNEGDIDIERYRGNTAGNETFAFRATKVGGGASCGSSITLR